MFRVFQSAQSLERGQLARRVAESTRRFPILSCIGRATSPERVVVETAAAAVSSQRSDSITGEEYCLLRPRIAGEATPCKDASKNAPYSEAVFGLKQNYVAPEIAKTKCESSAGLLASPLVCKRGFVRYYEWMCSDTWATYH